MNTNRWQIWQIDLAGAITCVILTGLAMLAVVQPLRHSLAGAAILESKLEDQRAQALSLDQALGKLQRRLTVAQEELDAQAVQLQPATSLNSRIARLTMLIESTGMVIEETSVGELETGTWYQTVPIGLAGRGTFPQCAALLHRLHVEATDIGVVAFELTGNPRVPERPAQFKLDLEWYAASGGTEMTD